MSTAVILAGGKSSRMKRDKLALRFGTSSLLASCVGRFSASFDTVYLSVGELSKYPEIEARRLVDIFKGCGPIAGLHAGLLGTEEEGVFLVAADLPYADPGAALRIMELSGDADVCITADSQSRYEPLFGFYRKTILPYVESALQSGDYKLSALLGKVKTRIVTKGELGSLYHDRLLININYPEDYERVTGEAPERQENPEL